MSDHGSGPRAIADPVADISDFYVFPSPERPGEVVLVMNVFPFAMPTALFSEPVVLPDRANTPKASFDEPRVLPDKAAAPMAVLALPVVVICSTPAPAAVLKTPLVRPPSAMYSSTTTADTAMLAWMFHPSSSARSAPIAYMLIPEEKMVMTAKVSALKPRIVEKRRARAPVP